MMEKERPRSSRQHSDLQLMELADRNPSLGGRELLRELIERGTAPTQLQDTTKWMRKYRLEHFLSMTRGWRIEGAINKESVSN